MKNVLKRCIVCDKVEKLVYLFHPLSFHILNWAVCDQPHKSQVAAVGLMVWGEVHRLKVAAAVV